MPVRSALAHRLRRQRGYVRTIPSTTDQREKAVELTAKSIEFVTARLKAAGELDRAIRARLGTAGLDQLNKALAVLGDVARGAGDLDPAVSRPTPQRSCGVAR